MKKKIGEILVKADIALYIWLHFAAGYTFDFNDSGSYLLPVILFILDAFVLYKAEASFGDWK